MHWDRYPMYVDSAYTVSLGANDGAVGVLFDGASFYSACSRRPFFFESDRGFYVAFVQKSGDWSSRGSSVRSKTRFSNASRETRASARLNSPKSESDSGNGWVARSNTRPCLESSVDFLFV